MLSQCDHTDIVSKLGLGKINLNLLYFKLHEEYQNVLFKF